jgi:hypothetical protein
VGNAVLAVESYDDLAEYSAFSIIHGLKIVCERSGLRELPDNAEKTALQRNWIRRVAEAPINGMYTITQLFQVLPAVMRLSRPMEPYTAEELTGIAANSNEVVLNLASDNGYRSRLYFSQLAIAPHISFAKDGRLIQREPLDPRKFSITEIDGIRKLVISQPEAVEAAACAVHEQLAEKTELGTPDFDRSGRCPAYDGLAAIQSRLAAIAGQTLFEVEAELSELQLPGESYYDEGPAIVRKAIDANLPFLN